MGSYTVRVEMECDITVEATSMDDAEEKVRQIIVSQYGGAVDIYSSDVIEGPIRASDSQTLTHEHMQAAITVLGQGGVPHPVTLANP